MNSIKSKREKPIKILSAINNSKSKKLLNQRKSVCYNLQWKNNYIMKIIKKKSDEIMKKLLVYKHLYNPCHDTHIFCSLPYDYKSLCECHICSRCTTSTTITTAITTALMRIHFNWTWAIFRTARIWWWCITCGYR